MKSRQSNRTPTHRIIAVSLFTASALAALSNHAFSEGGKIAFTSIRDGRTIAYSTSPKPDLWFAPFNIYLMNADGTHLAMLTEGRRWAYEYTPNWSNDGTRIVYDRQKPDGTSDIYAINADGRGTANHSDAARRRLFGCVAPFRAVRAVDGQAGDQLGRTETAAVNGDYSAPVDAKFSRRRRDRCISNVDSP